MIYFTKTYNKILHIKTYKNLLYILLKFIIYFTNTIYNKPSTFLKKKNVLNKNGEIQRPEHYSISLNKSIINLNR